MTYSLRLLTALAIALAGLACASEGGGGSSAGSAKNDQKPVKPADLGPAVIRTPVAPGAPQQQLPPIPKNAKWTISVMNVDASQGDPVRTMERLKNDVMRMPQFRSLKDWYVIHWAGNSTLYYGFYGDIKDDAGERERARRDREMIKNGAVTPSGEPYFAQVTLAPIDFFDPGGPPEWDLRNARGYWTLQIAVFTGPDRKTNAVEAVKSARSEHRVEAYYYHGPTVSSVCVGAWPESAVSVQNAEVKTSRAESGMPLVVLPPGLGGNRINDETVAKLGSKEGEDVAVRRPEVTINDRTLLETQQRFPDHAVDGRVMERTIRDRRENVHIVRHRSFVVQIPAGGAQAAPVAREQLAPPPQGWEGKPTGGGLRSIRD